MSDLWTALAERFVAEQRVRFANLLGQPPASQSRLPMLLEMIVGGSGADAAAVAAFRSADASDIEILRRLLHDPSHMHFVKVLAEDADWCPPELVADMVRGAVYTVDPSANRVWIKRTVAVNSELVRDTLLGFLENGTPFEIGGAANAFYWFGAFNQRHQPPVDPATSRQRIASLTKFVEIDDTELRQCLVSNIDWNPANYPSAIRNLVELGRRIASTHDDEYIQQRFLCDTNQSGALPCLPHRSPKV